MNPRLTYFCKAFLYLLEHLKKYGTLFMTKARDVQTGSRPRQVLDGDRLLLLYKSSRDTVNGNLTMQL